MVTSWKDRLRQERLQRNWRQRDVAEQLGTTALTVNRWEQGKQLPSAYFRVKLCALFGKSAQELGLVEANLPPTILEKEKPEAEEAGSTLTSTETQWTISYSRNPFFIGRDQLLCELHDLLTRREHTTTLAHAYALHGLGGIGKTQVALEYAYRYRAVYTAILWVNAETADTLLSSFVSLAEILNLPEHHEQDQQKVVDATRRWLEDQQGWLLIYDNVEDLTLLQPFLPTSSRGSLLLTTRLQALGSIARPIAVELLNPEESQSLLLQRAKLLQPGRNSAQLLPGEARAAQAIVKELDGLPLALDQAGAYIEESQCGLEGYLQRYRNHRSLTLARRGHQSQDHPASVQTTLILSLQWMKQKNSIAADMLQLCAFLAPDAIPEEMFTTACSVDGEQEAPMASDLWLLDETIAVLGTASLVRRDAMTRTLSVHRLVQTVILETLSEQERDRWIRYSLSVLNQLFPDAKQKNLWSQCERLIPHILACAEYARIHSHASEDEALALFKAGAYLLHRAQYQTAEPLLQRAAQIREHMLGSEHPLLALPLNSLGNLYREQGTYAEAQRMYQRALHIREQALGDEHPLVGASLANLGHLFSEQGKYPEAAELLKRACHIQERVLGAEHPEVANILNNLGVLSYRQGRYAEAENAWQKAYSIYEHSSGGELSQKHFPLTNLGELYLRQGRYHEARASLQQALQIAEHPFGREHPHSAENLFLLACCALGEQNEVEAQQFYEQALAVWEKTLGLDHPHVVDCLKFYTEFDAPRSE